jgi:acyl carrier protein
MLCDLFSEVLSCGAVNVGDSFFALGGDSLLAAQLIARIRTVFRVELPIRVLFDAPTVAALSDRLPGGAAAREPLVPQPRPARLPLSYAQARLWFLHHLEGQSATYNVTTALRLHGALDVGAFSRAVDDVAARHESLRTIFPEAAGTPYQEIIAPGALSSLLEVKRIAEDDLPNCLSCPGPARAVAAGAPHCRGRLVVGPPGSRPDRCLRRARRGPPGELYCTAGAVCRLRSVAATYSR